MKKIISLLFFVGVTCITLPVRARWMKSSEATRKIVSRIENVFVDENYLTHTEISEVHEVLADAGRQDLSLYKIEYNGASHRFEFVSAYSKNKKKIDVVDPAAVSTKDLSSGGPAFDTKKEVMIPFRGLQIGSRVHITYRLIRTKTPLPNFVSFLAAFAAEGVLTEKEELRIESKVPLYFSRLDYFNRLEVQKSEKNGLYHWKIRLKKPILLYVVDEANNINTQKLSSVVAFSSMRNWGGVYRSLRQKPECKKDGSQGD